MTTMDFDQLAEDFLARRRHRFVEAGPLAQVLRAGRLVRHDDGQVICREGDEGRSLYFLVAGKVRVERSDLAGGSRPLTTIEAPSMVGHMAMMDGSRRSATCIAEGTVTLVEIDQRTYNYLIDDRGAAGTALRRVLLASLTRQLIAGNQRLSEVSTRASTLVPDDDSTEEVRHRPSSHPLAGVDDILTGWDLNAPELDQVSVVYTEEQLRNWKGGRRPKG